MLNLKKIVSVTCLSAVLATGIGAVTMPSNTEAAPHRPPHRIVHRPPHPRFYQPPRHRCPPPPPRHRRHHDIEGVIAGIIIGGIIAGSQTGNCN